MQSGALGIYLSLYIDSGPENKRVTTTLISNQLRSHLQSHFNTPTPVNMMLVRIKAATVLVSPILNLVLYD